MWRIQIQSQWFETLKLGQIGFRMIVLASLQASTKETSRCVSLVAVELHFEYLLPLFELTSTFQRLDNCVKV